MRRYFQIARTGGGTIGHVIAHSRGEAMEIAATRHREEMAECGADVVAVDLSASGRVQYQQQMGVDDAARP